MIQTEGAMRRASEYFDGLGKREGVDIWSLLVEDEEEVAGEEEEEIGEGEEKGDEEKGKRNGKSIEEQEREIEEQMREYFNELEEEDKAGEVEEC